MEQLSGTTSTTKFTRETNKWSYLTLFLVVLLLIGSIWFYVTATQAATRQLLANPFFANKLGPWSNIPPEYVTASGIRMGLRFNGVDNGVDLSSNFTPATADNFTFEFWVKPEAAHEIDVQSNSGTAGASGQKYALAPDARTGNDAGMGISVGTNGVSVYENFDGYTPPLLVHDMTSTPITTWTHITNGTDGLLEI